MHSPVASSLCMVGAATKYMIDQNISTRNNYDGDWTTFMAKKESEMQVLSAVEWKGLKPNELENIRFMFQLNANV